MWCSLFSAVVASLIVAGSALTPEFHGQRRAEPPIVEGFIENQYQFINEVLQRLAAKCKSVVFSPVSIRVLLEMLYGGTAGNTRSQLASAAHFDAVPDLENKFHDILRHINAYKNATLLAANGIYASDTYHFLPEYLDTIRNYHSEIVRTDFTNKVEARQKINARVGELTEGHIENFLPTGSILPSSGMVLVNAIYFKGLWEMPFDPERTSAQKFYTSKDEYVMTQMMSRVGHFKVIEHDLFQVVALPFRGRELHINIVLPREKDGLAMLPTDAAIIERNVEELHVQREQTVLISIPKFEIRTNFSALRLLREMGVTDLFASGVCDLSGMDGTGSLHVSQFLHEAVLKVDEGGSEGVAASELADDAAAMPKIITADHPFLLTISHVKDDVTYLGGMLLNPLA